MNVLVWTPPTQEPRRYRMCRSPIDAQDSHAAILAIPSVGSPCESGPMTNEVQITRLEAIGATRAYRVEPDKSTMESGFITMHDPEGNEFCLD